MMQVVNIALSLLANSILKSYFGHLYCLFIFNDVHNEFTYYTDNGSSMAVIYYNFDEVSNKTNFEIKDHRCEGIVISSSKPKILFEKIEYKIKTSFVHRYNRRMYLILMSPNQTEEELDDLFNAKELLYIPNFLVVNSTKKIPYCVNKFKIDYCDVHFEYSLLTNKYVGRRDDNLKLIFVDKWFSNNESYLFNNTLYPDKLLNQKRRTLRLATLNYPPFNILLKTVSNSIGVETNIAVEYAKKRNMSIEYVIDEVGQWGRMNDNWTGIGILGNVGTDHADIGYAALYLSWFQEYKFMDFSFKTSRTGVTLLVPKPRLASGWSVPFFSFSKNMWIATTASFATCVLALFLVTLCMREKFKRILNLQIPIKFNSYVDILENSIFESSALFLLQSSSKVKIMKKVYRYLFSIFIFTVFLSSSYSSGLASSMTIPRYSEGIRTVADLRKSSILWGATHNAWILAIENSEEEKFKEILPRFTIASAKELEKLTFTRKFCFVFERLPGGYFSLPHYIKQDAAQNLRVMTEDLYWAYCVFMLKKSSHLLPSLDALTMRISEAGIDSAWEPRIVLGYTNARVQETVRYYYYNGEDIKITKLKWMHVKGAFGILLLGYTMSFLCFLVECVIHKIRK